jgi:hypothetical protein
VPTGYLEGLDWTLADAATGHSFGAPYVLGHLDPSRRGFALYYLVHLAVKVPLAILVLAAIGLARGRVPRAARVVVHGFGLALLVFLSLGNNAQIGLRHAFPLLPGILLEAGVGLALLRDRSRGTAVALVLALAASVCSYAPDFVPYVNELVLDRTRAHRVVADSNLDWGQARGTLAEWIRLEHAAGQRVAFEPAAPTAGRVVVGVNELVGINDGPERYAWLRDLTPVGHVRHVYLVYEPSR